MTGGLETIPRLVVPAKNSTVATKPSGSNAFAKMGMFTGAVKPAPSGGEANRTTGGTFVTLLPMM